MIAHNIPHSSSLYKLMVKVYKADMQDQYEVDHQVGISKVDFILFVQLEAY